MDSIYSFSIHASSKFPSDIMDYVTNKEKINIFPILKKMGIQGCGFLAFPEQTDRQRSWC